MFEPGEQIEFFSSRDGGRWLRGTVETLLGKFAYMIDNPRSKAHHYRNAFVRIRVSEEVCIIRPFNKCRRVP